MRTTRSRNLRTPSFSRSVPPFKTHCEHIVPATSLARSLPLPGRDPFPRSAAAAVRLRDAVWKVNPMLSLSLCMRRQTAYKTSPPFGSLSPLLTSSQFRQSLNCLSLALPSLLPFLSPQIIVIAFCAALPNDILARVPINIQDDPRKPPAKTAAAAVDEFLFVLPFSLSRSFARPNFCRRRRLRPSVQSVIDCQPAAAAATAAIVIRDSSGALRLFPSLSLDRSICNAEKTKESFDLVIRLRERGGERTCVYSPSLRAPRP